MQLPRILNKVRKFKGYVYENVTLSQDGKRLDVHIRPRKGASPRCSGCGRKGPVYDQLPKARRFGFVPLGQTVFRSVRYAVPRGIAIIRGKPWRPLASTRLRGRRGTSI